MERFADKRNTSMIERVTDAIVLMAGSGSRLLAGGHVLPKPLIQIAGRPLFSYTIEALSNAGIKTVHAITGRNGDLLLPTLMQLVPTSMRLNPIHNPNSQKQNGLSVLVAAPHVGAPFLLTMGDHLFDFAIVDLLIRRADFSSLNVAVDRKLATIFDLADAMKIKTNDDCVVGIDKNLDDYDAIDTGLFVCSSEIFRYLDEAKSRNSRSDCSLADGVRAMAADGKVRAIDIGDAWWQDIDTPEMLAHAEKLLRS
jgi:1L-myo-inositol 1-phosphate cytidylyltransferase